MAKHIYPYFLQEIEEVSQIVDERFEIDTINKFVTVLKGLIKELEQKIERTYRLKKRKNLCKDERTKIDEHLQKRINSLMDKKTYLIETVKRLVNSPVPIDVNKEIEIVLGAIITKGEDNAKNI